MNLCMSMRHHNTVHTVSIETLEMSLRGVFMTLQGSRRTSHWRNINSGNLTYQNIIIDSDREVCEMHLQRDSR